MTGADEGILGVLAGHAVITGGAVRVRAATQLGQRDLSQRWHGKKTAARLRWRSELAWLTIGSFLILIWEVARQQTDRAIPQLRELISSASALYGGCGRPPIS